MALREFEFLDKFWLLPGGATLIQELLLALIHRRILSINRVKVEKQEIITEEQLAHCNGLVESLERLGLSFRSFIDSGPDECELLQRLKEVIIQYKCSIRVCHRRLRVLFSHEPAEDETSKTLLMKLTSDPATIPYYKSMAVELVRLYICYIEVIRVVIQTNNHYGQPIGLNILGIESVLSKLRSLLETLERMTIMPTDLRSNESRNCDPLYLLLKNFHYMIKTLTSARANLLFPPPRQPKALNPPNDPQA